MKPFDTFASGTIGGRTMKPYEIAPPRVEPLASASSGRAELKSFEILPSAQVAAAGLSAASRSLKAYEIVPPAGAATSGVKGGGCGCGGKCGPCGKAAEVAGEFRSRSYLPFGPPRYVENLVRPGTSYVPPVLEGGGDPVLCERINREVELLVNLYWSFLRRHEELMARYERCYPSDSLGVTDCYSFQLEENRLHDMQNALADAREDAVRANDQNAVMQIDREIDDLNAQRRALVAPQQECDMAVAAHIRDRTVSLPAYEAECERLRELVRRSYEDRTRFAEFFRKAIINYRDWATRNHCTLHNWGQDELFMRDERWLFHYLGAVVVVR